MASPLQGALSACHLRDEAGAARALEAAGGAVLFTFEARPAAGGLLESRRRPADPPTATASFAGWPNGEPVPFVLAFDGRRTVTLTLFQGDRRTAVAYESAEAAGCDELFVSAVAAAPGSRAGLSGLRLGEAAVGDAPAAGAPAGEDVLRLRAAGLARGFALSGAIILIWAGETPPESGLHVRLWGARAPVAAPGGAPRVTITAPAPESVLADGAPTLAAAFSTSGPETDPSAVRLTLDGADRTPVAEITAAGLVFTPPVRLPEGRHTARVAVRGPDGSEAAAAVAFITDTVPPSIAFASPGREVVDDPAPVIRLTYSDATSGLDFQTLRVTLDGRPIDPVCVANLVSGVCLPPPLPAGSHLLTAAIRDRAGNLGTTSFPFSLTLRTDGGEP